MQFRLTYKDVHKFKYLLIVLTSDSEILFLS